MAVLMTSEQAQRKQTEQKGYVININGQNYESDHFAREFAL